MNKILFIGQAPSRESEFNPPFTGRCGKFLASLMDISQQEMLELFEFKNILDYWPGSGGGGDAFPRVDASLKAQKMWPTLADRPTILLGRNVANAFKISTEEAGYMRWHLYFERGNRPVPVFFTRIHELLIRPPSIDAKLIAIVPHPSGVNRWYNDDQNKREASGFLTRMKVAQLRANESLDNICDDYVEVVGERHREGRES